MNRLTLLLLLASTLLMGSPVRAAAPAPTLEAELVDAGHVRLRGRGFAQAKLEVTVEPVHGDKDSLSCVPPALRERVGVRRGAFDVTLELDAGCRLTCGTKRSAWRVRAVLPEGEEVARTEPLGCEPSSPGEAEVRLRTLWRQWNPGRLLPPACDHEDPVRVLEGDVDESPGVETVLASRRFGVFVLGAKPPERPLAWKELACEQAPFVDAEEVPRLVELTTLRASGLSPVDLVLHTVRSSRCGSIGYQEVLDRRGRTLVTLLEVEVFKHWQCWNLPLEDMRARVESPAPGLVRVTEDGTTQAVGEGGELAPPVTFHRVREFRLVGRTFAPAAPQPSPR